MMILYTVEPGGRWIPFNTPLNDMEIQKAIAVAEIGKRDQPAIFLGVPEFGWPARFYPDGDTLPRFHSILLDDNSRWDAETRRWTQYSNDEYVQQWRRTYIANFQWDGDLGWRDQGPATF